MDKRITVNDKTVRKLQILAAHANTSVKQYIEDVIEKHVASIPTKTVLHFGGESFELTTKKK